MALTPSQRAKLLGRFKRKIEIKKAKEAGPPRPVPPQPSQPGFVGPPAPSPPPPTAPVPIVEPEPEQKEYTRAEVEQEIQREIQEQKTIVQQQEYVLDPMTPKPGESPRVYFERIGRGPERGIISHKQYYTDPSGTRYKRGRFIIEDIEKSITEREKYIKELEESKREISGVPYFTEFEKTPTGYRVSDLDYGQYWRDVKKRQEEENLVLAKMKQVSMGVLYAFKPEWWTSAAFASREEYERYVGRWEYQQQTGLQKGKAWEVWAGIQAPAYTNIILPFAIGAGFGAGLGWVGRAGTGGAIVARGVPIVMGGAIVTTVGADIGVTAAETGGFLSKESMTKYLGYSMQFTSAGAGYKWATGYKPTIGVAEGPGKTLVWQKHLTTFRGKPVLPYGKPEPFGMTPSGITRVVSPFPSSAKGLRFKTPSGFLKDTIGFGPKPKWPFVPSGLSKAPTIYGHPPMGKPVPIVKYKGRYSFITGEGWQPQTGFRYLPSTKVWPKPLPHPRAYEHHFFTMVFAPKPIVSVKPFKRVFTVKDIIKPDTIIDKGIVSGIGRQQTILKPPRVKTVTKTITQTKQIVVPESLLKPVYKQEKVQVLKPKMEMFKELSQAYKTRQAQVYKDTSKFFLGLGLQQKQSFAQLEKQLQLQEQKKTQIYAFGQLQSQLQAQLQGSVQLQGFVQSYRYDLVPEYVQTYKTVTPKIPVIPIPTVPTFKPPPPLEEKPPPPSSTIIKLLGFEGAGRQTIRKEPSGQGYQVHVKSRQYYQGKPRGPEKHRLLSRTVYNYDDAKNIMGYVLDNSVAQQGFIKPVDKPISKKRKQTSVRWTSIGHKFFTNKSGKTQEHRAFAIDTRGEKLQLNAFRVYGRLPVTKVKSKSFNVDMYGFDILEHKIKRSLRRLR